VVINYLKTIIKQQKNNTMKNIFFTIIILALTTVSFSQLTVDPSNGNVGIKDSSPEQALSISGWSSMENFGTSYILFNDMYSGELSTDIDKNGIRWQTPNQGPEGLDSLRYYLLYNYARNRLLFDNNDDYSDGVSMSIKQSGEVGIGVEDPLNPFHVNGDALFNSGVGNLKFGFPTGSGFGFSTTGGGSVLYLSSYDNTSTEAGQQIKLSINADGNMGLGVNNASEKLQVDGSITISGEYLGYSDRILKDDIESIENGLHLVNALKPVNYSFKTSEFPDLDLPLGTKHGLIAQDVEMVLPNAVKTGSSAIDVKGDKHDIKAVNYNEIIPILISAVQELTDELELKDTEINKLKKQVETHSGLESRITKLEALLAEQN